MSACRRLMFLFCALGLGATPLRADIDAEYLIYSSYAISLTPGITIEALADSDGASYGPGETRLFLSLEIVGPAILRGETGAAVDRVNAATLLGRLLWSGDRIDAARASFGAALAEARAAGMGDRELPSLLADLAVLEWQAGRAALAREYLRGALTCGVPDCPEDVMRRVAEIATPSNRAEVDADVDRLLRRDLPALRDRYWIRHLQGRVFELEDTRPTEAADYADRAYYENAGNPASALLAMHQALKVNRFLRAQEIASDLVLRGGEAEMTGPERLRFQRMLTRAKARGGDVSAAADYSAIADLAVSLLATTEGDLAEPLFREAVSLLDDIMDTTNLAAADRLQDALRQRNNTLELWTRTARLRHRQGDSAAAAEMMRQARALDWIDDRRRLAFQVQEAVYARAAGQVEVAEALLSTLTRPEFALPATGRALGDAFTLIPPSIREVWAIRDEGNPDGAAWLMAEELDFVPALVERGSYLDAQVLWQMAFTLAQGGAADAAFAVMTEAARIAARLSFEDPQGAEGGTLQLLHRDRYRYLLFVDIAWSAVTRRTPEEMLMIYDY